MDDFTTEIMASTEDATASDSSSQPRQHDDEKQAQKKGWGGLAGLRDRTSIQDRLVDRYGLDCWTPYPLHGCRYANGLVLATGFFSR